MKRAVPFIRDDESLFVFYDDGDHYGYAGPIFTVDDVITKLDGTDGAIRLVRYDNEFNRGEDITEEVADAFIKAFGEDIDEESNVDPWLEGSGAYQDHIDDLTEEAFEVALYGPCEDQHRLRISDVL